MVPEHPVANASARFVDISMQVASKQSIVFFFEARVSKFHRDGIQ